MKTNAIFITLLTFLVGAAQVAAQPTDQMARLSAALGLNETQAEEVQSILAAQGDKRRALMQDVRSGNGDRATARSKMRALGDETEALLADVLDDNQLEAYRKLVAERRARMRGQRGR